MSLLLIVLHRARPIHRIMHNLRIKDIDLRGCKLPRADSSLKKQVQLGKAAPSWFRDTKIGVNDAAETYTGP
jgi:hypothetical protein